ncbi:MAG: hypothetical protein KA604_03015 [Candidatus Saccharimonas sp.]|nr:hypothetical protein [Candidatus Saccharimonas sp.]
MEHDPSQAGTLAAKRATIRDRMAQIAHGGVRIEITLPNGRIRGLHVPKKSLSEDVRKEELRERESTEN